MCFMLWIPFWNHTSIDILEIHFKSISFMFFKQVWIDYKFNIEARLIGFWILVNWFNPTHVVSILHKSTNPSWYLNGWKLISNKLTKCVIHQLVKLNKPLGNSKLISFMCFKQVWIDYKFNIEARLIEFRILVNLVNPTHIVPILHKSTNLGWYLNGWKLITNKLTNSVWSVNKPNLTNPIETVWIWNNYL